MAWFGLDKLILGVDLDAEEARGRQLDADKDKLDAQRQESGYWTQETYDLARDQSATGQTGNVTQEVNTAFGTGFQEGADNVRTTIGGTINGTVGQVFRLIPWQVWVLGIVAAVIYFWPALSLAARRFSK